MKKFILIVAAAMLTFVAGAVTYMRVETHFYFDLYDVDMYNVDKVEKVDYEKDAETGTIYMRTTTTDGKVTKYDVEKVVDVKYITAAPNVDVVSVSGEVGGYSYVDLGLKSGLKWATCNVGATKPTESGDYFAWGETKPKEDYSWETYKWCDGSYNTQTKYCTDSLYGTRDNKTVLEAADDAATANWGSAWRMPTTKEQQELLVGCDWKWTYDFNGTGVAGQIGTSKANGAKIFLPAAGERTGTDLRLAGDPGCYWSSSLSEIYMEDAYHFYIDGKYVNCRNNIHRHSGLSVRAVVK